MSINYSKEWSLEEASAAQSIFLANNPSYSDCDPRLPLFQWAASKRLDEFECLFASDKYYLMLAIRVCANHDLPLPDWVSSAYIMAFDKVHNYQHSSWDSVFDKPFPKGKSLSAARKKRVSAHGVWVEITNEHRKGKPIDEALFEEIGKKFNIGKTLASEFYYEVKKQLGF